MTGPCSYLRMRLGPDVNFGMGLRMKHPGERMTGDNVELTLMERLAPQLPPYQRLLGDAMRGNNELFGREDAVSPVAHRRADREEPAFD